MLYRAHVLEAVRPGFYANMTFTQDDVYHVLITLAILAALGLIVDYCVRWLRKP